MHNLIDLTGQRYGTFTVQARALDVVDATAAWWSLQCDCGQQHRRRTDVLRLGKGRCWRCDGGRRPPTRLLGSMAERLEAASEFVTESGCQIWMAATNSTGYGHFLHDGKHITAHRASWLTERGPIPDGLFVLHHCDVRPCINPHHLFLGTAADNSADMIRKGRQHRA